jgi:hypothetical protein
MSPHVKTGYSREWACGEQSEFDAEPKADLVRLTTVVAATLLGRHVRSPLSKPRGGHTEKVEAIEV